MAYPLTMKCNSFLKKQPNLSAKKKNPKNQINVKTNFYTLQIFIDIIFDKHFVQYGCDFNFKSPCQMAKIMNYYMTC